MSLAVLTGELVQPAEPDVLLQGGETLELAGLKIYVIHTPGHTKGGVCYALMNKRKLFVGDTLFMEGAGRTDFPGGSEKELYHSIADKLFTLEGDFDVYCGTRKTPRWNTNARTTRLLRFAARAAGKQR
jgi:glyoxylase-like metal-dependent hydrolase (beta-lactamase superfamily II)